MSLGCLWPLWPNRLSGLDPYGFRCEAAEKAWTRRCFCIWFPQWHRSLSLWSWARFAFELLRCYSAFDLFALVGYIGLHLRCGAFAWFFGCGCLPTLVLLLDGGAEGFCGRGWHLLCIYVRDYLYVAFTWCSRRASLLQFAKAYIIEFAFGIMAEDEKGTSAWFKLPTWDGSPAHWRSFRKEMDWWVSSLDLEATKRYNLAARWLLRQSGVVRQRGEEFIPAELAYKKAEVVVDPDTGEEFEVSPADPLAGLNKLLAALESINGKTDLDKKGELRSQFYLELKRKPCERISEFTTRFRTLTAEMKLEGIVLPPAELGWFLREKLGLDSIRKQLLETALQGRDRYEDVEIEVLRLFKDLHTADPLYKRSQHNDGKPSLMQRFLNHTTSHPRSSASTSGSGSVSPFGRGGRFGGSSGSVASSRHSFRSSGGRPPPRQTMVTEYEEAEEEPEYEDEAGGGEEVGGTQTLEEVLQCEAEQLASEIQMLEEDGNLDPSLVEELESGVEAAAESLVTMREARTKIADLKKDRGYGRVGGGPGSPSKAHGNQVNSSKKTSKCFDCGEYGHWKGDKECQKPGAGLCKPKAKAKSKQVLIAEVLNTEHLVEEATNEQQIHEVQAVGLVPHCTLSEALVADDGPPTVVEKSPLRLADDKRLVGALDSACNRTCIGPTWLNEFVAKLMEEAPKEIVALIRREKEQELFRFGNGGLQKSTERWRLPVMVGDTLVLFWTSVVSVPSLGLLLGRDFLDGVGAVLAFTRRVLRCDHLDGSLIPLRQMAAGHYLLPLLPLRWKRPGSEKWRRAGQDGVVELQLQARDWAAIRMKAQKAARSRESEHFVTERSFMAADVKHSGLTSSTTTSSDGCLAPAAQAIMRRACSGDRTTTTSSSTSRSSSRSSNGSESQPHAKSAGRGGRALLQVRKPNRAEERGTLEEVRPANAQKSTMAHPWRLALAFATAWSAVRPNAVPIGLKHKPMDVAGGKHDGQQVLSQETPSTGFGQGGLQHGESGRWNLPSQSTGIAPSLSGRSFGGGHVGCKGDTRDVLASEGPSTNRGQSLCKEVGVRGEADGGSKSSFGTSRRPSYASSRVGATGGLGSHRGRGQGHGGHHQAEDPSSGADNPGVSKWFKIPRKRQEDDPTGSSTSASEHRNPGGLWSNGRRTFNNHGSGTGTDCGGSSGASESTRSEVPRNDVSSDAGGHEHAGEPDDNDRSSGPGCNGGDLECFKSTRRGRAVHPGGDRSTECRVLPRGETPTAGDGRSAGPLRCTSHGGRSGDLREVHGEARVNPWRLHQDLKKGIATMVSQAWQQHERDRRLVSRSSKEILEVMQSEWEASMQDALNETFMTAIRFGDKDNPFVSEVYTNTQRVMKEAVKRGHRVGTAMSLETGWDFLKEEDRKKAFQQVKKEKPYFLMLAFPCGPWSPLMNLNPAMDLELRRAEGLILIRFALDLAKLQASQGRHFALENPLSSMAWRLEDLVKFVEESDCYVADFHQCRLGLKGRTGKPHRKATRMVSSSKILADNLDGLRCQRDHQHEPVIGGAHVTGPSGHYPIGLARALVSSMEKQFEFESKKQNEVSVAELGEEDFQEDEEEILREGAAEEEFSSEDEDGKEKGPMRISPGIKNAVARLHANTGHRSNARLARALAISGAPAEVVYAAKHHKCSICQEQRAPRSRRPASLPVPKDAGDQANIDLVEVMDAAGQKFFVVHMVDHATRFQLAGLLKTKSTADVVSFIRRHWMPVFGPPRVMVCDQGREFISWEMEEFASAHSIVLWHAAVGAPWQNGICERAGGTLKVILASIVNAHQVQDFDELAEAIGEAVSAYNTDCNELGVSPAQAAIGRQPKLVGDVLGNFGQRLAEHGLHQDHPGFARQLALRETAKLAMTRLHFSRSIRKAEVARSRTSTITSAPAPGSIVYFWRQQKYNSRTAPAKRRLALRRWHGPGLVVAHEGVNVYISHKGQLTKCPLEHVRLASTLEQIAATTWQDAIEESVEHALRDLASQAEDARDAVAQPALMDGGGGGEQVRDSGGVQVPEPLDDLPPVAPAELVAAFDGGGSLRTTPATSAFPSRRVSVGEGAASMRAQPGSPVPDLIRRASQTPTPRPSVLEPVLERLQQLQAQPEAEGDGGNKRSAEVPVESLRESTEADERGTPVVQTHELMEATSVSNPSVHPLFRLQAQAMLDRQDPEKCRVEDHGSWDGRWELPSVCDWKARSVLGLKWPSGRSEFEIQAVQAARKEYRWKIYDPRAEEGF